MERDLPPGLGALSRFGRWWRVRIFQARTNAPPWRCAECRAANHAGTLECSHGCGEREDLEAYDPRVSHEPVTAAGSVRRRG